MNIKKNTRKKAKNEILEAKAKSLFPRKENVLAMNIKKNTRKKAKN